MSDHEIGDMDRLDVSVPRSIRCSQSHNGMPNRSSRQVVGLFMSPGTNIFGLQTKVSAINNVKCSHGRAKIIMT